LDYASPTTYQTYSKIIDLELRVTTPLSTSQDEETAIMSVTGTALFYPIPHVIPNAGDLFLAATGDFHQGVYRISGIERKSFNRDAVYELTYELAFLVDADPIRYNDLEQRVGRTHYFHKDRLVQGLNPLIQAPEQAQYQAVQGSYEALVRYYCQTFYHVGLQTFILPGQHRTVYDPFLVSYLLKIVGILEAPEMARVRHLDVEKEPYIAQPQFWTALLERRWTVLDYANKTMGLVTADAFGRDPLLKAPRYSGIDYLVYPIDPDTSTASPPYIPVKPQTFATLVETETAPLTMDSPLKEQYIDINQTIPYIHPVLADPYYVFRASFYNRSSSMSLLEALTVDYLLHRPITLSRLDAIVAHVKGWGRLEQYYYTPVVLTLVKAVQHEPTAP
jgi:hypothetical protein